MKRIILLASMLLFSVGILRAQLPNGSTAPDWTLTDINGNSHHLYSYLDSGYTVFIDFSATWCPSCWNYHNSGALENLYNQYGPSGTNEVRVFFIEGDASTNLACLYGSSGCNSSTKGNWVAGTPYPIINDASQTSPYKIPWWPTIYGIYPNHEITYLSQPSTAQAYAFHNITGIEEAIWAEDLQIYPNPSTGLIYIDFGKIRKADLKVFNALGELVYDYTGVPFGKKEINLSEMAAGIYLVRIASANDIVYRKITIE